MLTPAQFAIVRGAKLYDWQIEALEAFGRGWPTALLTCNGAGKTAVVASWAVAWFFYAFPKGKLAATSGSFNQLQNQLWPALKQNLPKGSTATNGTSPCTIRTPQGGRGIGFSTNDPGKAEGFHPLISKDVDPVMILVDEAKTVPDGIFIAFDRCTYSFVLYISSAGAPLGRFFECFGKLGKYYYTKKIPSTLCPHIDPWKRERDREVMDAVSFASAHEAEFVEDGTFMVMSTMGLSKAVDYQPQPLHGERVAAFDFARGGDENVFVERNGNEVEIVETWRETDSVQAVRHFISIARFRGLKPHQCWGDADGIGGSMCDVFDDEGYSIHRFRGGMPATEPETYENLISEVWIEGARKILRGDICFKGRQIDPITFEQLTNRLIQWSAKGKRQIEPKPKMKMRGVKSPDRADGVLMSIFCGRRLSGSATAESFAAPPKRNEFGFAPERFV
jgi:phage terminase large subunit